MARAAFACTLDASGAPLTGGATDILNASTVATTKAAVEAEMATLQGQGAAPTAAQVDATDTALIAFVADVAAVYPTRTDVVLTVDLATVTTLSKLRKVLNALFVQAEGSGRFTA